MKPTTSVKTFLYLILALVCVAGVGCGHDFGEKVMVEKTEIYYKDGATKEDAERLGEKLKEMNFIDGNRKSVQLLKRENVWEFRMATSEAGRNDEAKDPVKLYCLQLSSCFDGDEVEVHFCDQKLETKSIVKGLRGKRYQLGRNLYFYKDIQHDQVVNFAAIAFGTLDNSAGYTYHLSQPKSAVEIRMANPKLSNDPAEVKRLATAARDAAVAASNKLFGGKQVDVKICDAFFGEQSSHSSTGQTAMP